MLDVEVIEAPAAAAVALDPIRSRILAVLAEPGSATTVARTLDLPRQKVNYHLRALEAQGLVTMVAVRARRGLTERMLQATAASYVVSPAALGEAAATPDRTDRLSSRYLIALAARMVREVATLSRRADAAGKPLATLAIDTEIRFASAGDRAAFTRDLAEAVADAGRALPRRVGGRRPLASAGGRRPPEPRTHPNPAPPTRNTTEEI